MLALKHRIRPATAAGRETISTISIPGCTITYTTVFFLDFFVFAAAVTIKSIHISVAH
jgi:hypothetical protein